MDDYKGYLATLILGIITVSLFSRIKDTVSALQSDALGPKLAKITTFWKLLTIRNGTYNTKLRSFHEYGGIVQIGPREYSLSNPPFIHQRCQPEKIDPQRLLVSSQVLEDVSHALQMANIYSYEPLLDKCNLALLQALVGHAEDGGDVDLSMLIARFAYDTMFCTTTGSAPGFLEGKEDLSSLVQAIESWKFHAVLYGSYLRFHPTIAKGLQWLGLGTGVKRAIARRFNTDKATANLCIANELHAADSGLENAPRKLDQATLEAAVALMISGADPVIAHLLASIYFTYQDVELVEALREELRIADLSQPPKLKELIHGKPWMSLLHAVLEESLRLIQTPTTSFISPKGGVSIGRENVPEGCTICCEPSIAYVNPHIFGAHAETFNPSRWLEDLAVARGFRNHMIAFGAGIDACPGKELHLSIVAKVFTQIISNFDFEMASVGTPASPVNLTVGDLKDLTIAKVILPKNMKPTLASPPSPLRPTAPAFAPETTTGQELPPGFTPMKAPFDKEAGTTEGSFKVVGKYAARMGDVCDFVPDATAHGGGDSDSPTVSVATTAKSPDISSTLMSWTDEQVLEDIIGPEMTKNIMTQFDPTSDLTPRPFLKTNPIMEGRNRYLLHELIERVWNGRLIHETHRKDNRMYIWVAGSKLPRWFDKIHQYRNRNDRNKVPNNQVKSMLDTSTAAPTKAPRAVDSVWTNFAQDENQRYSKVAAMSGDEYVAAERKKAEETGEKKSEDAPRTCTFRETFKQTGTNGTNGAPTEPSRERNLSVGGGNGASIHTTVIIKSEPKTSSVPPHLRARASRPPHFRNKSVDPEVKKEAEADESDSNKGVWCAAKLSSPYSSD